MIQTQQTFFINSFLANVPILYPLTTPENQRILIIFMGYKIETLVRDELRGNQFLCQRNAKS